MKKYIAVIDQGTTSSRCIIFDKSGQAVSSDQKEHRQIYPKPGWVEHDPVEIWHNVSSVIRGAMSAGGLTAGNISGIGITNQRETALVWDRNTGKPYCNAIVWQDTRTDALCRNLGGRAGADIYRAESGLPLATYFSGPKIKWMLDNIPGLRSKALSGGAVFGNIDSWIIWNLTGEHITDVSNASRTMLMNLDGCAWNKEICSDMGIPLSMLPEIRPSSDSGFYGFTRPDGPFGGSVPVCGDLGDQQAATVGQTCFNVGEAKNTYGTGCFMLMNTGEEIIPSKHGLLTTVCYKFNDSKPVYALEGSIAIAGSLIQWLRDNLKIISSAKDVEHLASQVADNGGMYFVPAFSGLFAPYWRSDARGAVVGMTGYVTDAHFARAALEAVAYQTREVFDAMSSDSGITLSALKADGGMTANSLLMQIQSDILNIDVVRPKVLESTALGAAYAAGLAVGYWQNTDELKKNWEADRIWSPASDDHLRNEGYRQWKKAVTRTFEWAE